MKLMDDNTNTNLQEYTVSEISTVIKKVIDGNFSYVKIRGEVSGIKYASSGHIYFNLKDDNAVIAATCWKNRMGAMQIKPEDGMEIICYGAITSYAAQSRYQINVEKIEVAGIGALMAMLEDRKKRLITEGLFNPEHKKPIPQFPETIALITSPQGAVIKDMLHRIGERYPVQVILFPVAVQGDNCAAQVTQAIIDANNYTENKIDTIIVARGGGSFEDLFPFNDETMARAAFASKIPIISAIGHETDFCILDYVADLRAPTPTAAAEFATPNKADLLARIDGIYKQIQQMNYRQYANLQTKIASLSAKIVSPENYIINKQALLKNYGLKLNASINNLINFSTIRLKNCEAKISVQAIQNKISYFEEKVNTLKIRYDNIMKASLLKLDNFLNIYSQSLVATDYHKTLDRGFTVVRNESNDVITSSKLLVENAEYSIEFKDGTKKFKVI